MATNYLFVAGWEPMGIIVSDEKPVGFDNGISNLCLDVGALTYEEAAPQWRTLMAEQYPQRVADYVKEMRELTYQQRGLSKENLAVHLWEALYEGKGPLAAQVQATRESIKAQFPTPQTLAEARDEHVITVNRLIGDVRVKYITSIPGQELTYQQKALEVQRYDADPAPDGANYPYLQAEATATGATLADVYQLVKATAVAWNQFGATVEGLRRGTIVALEAATTADAMDTVMTAFRTQVAQF